MRKKKNRNFFEENERFLIRNVDRGCDEAADKTGEFHSTLHEV